MMQNVDAASEVASNSQGGGGGGYFRYRYAIHRSGVFLRFENPSDFTTDGDDDDNNNAGGDGVVAMDIGSEDVTRFQRRRRCGC